MHTSRMPAGVDNVEKTSNFPTGYPQGGSRHKSAFQLDMHSIHRFYYYSDEY